MRYFYISPARVLSFLGCFLFPLRLNHFASLSLFLCLFSLSCLSSEARERTIFNRDYLFSLGDVKGAEQPGFNDSAWRTLHLPHSFSAPYWGDPRFHVGYGWYRKTFNAPTSWKGKDVFIEFDGVFQDCTVYLNGKEVGSHKGGYTGFSFNVTPFLKEGKNKLAIRVNNLWNPELAPRAGEHTFSGGIYRNVYLVLVDPVHVTYYGTFVKTPKISKESATINVETELENTSAQEVKGLLVTDILSPDGKVVSTLSSPYELNAGETRIFTQELPEVTHPQLWHPNSPDLYQASTKVYKFPASDKSLAAKKDTPASGKEIPASGKEIPASPQEEALPPDAPKGTLLCDTYATPFGIRWFEFTKDKGFMLNGEHLYIIGANVHQDHAGWGDAVTDEALRRDVGMIKETGMNFIRGSHYPHAPSFSKACDELGILLWSEGLFWGIGGFKGDGYWDSSAYPIDPAHEAAFEESLRQSLREMIRIHRNHPSIVTWSMGNEAFFTRKDVMDKAKDCARRLVDYAHELDPTRPAGLGGVQREGFDKIGDLAGYNGDGCLVTNPALPSLVAEYGSVVSHRPGEYDLYRGLLQPERFPWRSGEVLWCGFHHGSIANDMGRMGFVDYARLPLRSWYRYREELKGTPPPEWPKDEKPAKITLSASKTSLKTDGTDDAHIIVSLTDADGNRVNAAQPVTLTVTDGPGIFPTGKSITFEPNKDKRPSIIEGWAATEIRAYHAGKAKLKAESPGLPPATIELAFTDGPTYVSGKSNEGIPVAAPPTAPESATQIVECSKDRPTRTSSPASRDSARLLNDGNVETVWTTVLDDKGSAWWQVDLENFYTIDSVTLIKCSAKNFAVAVSADEGKTWVPIGDASTASKSEDNEITYALKPQDKTRAHGRFLRIMYTGEAKSSVSQADIIVKGKLSK